MPTIKDVAREAGVSTATVSYVLNQKKSYLISPTTRDLVLAAVKKVGYAPNTAARNLKVSQSHLIGYAWHIVPATGMNSVLDSFTYYLAQSAEAAGYHLLTFTHTAKGPLPVYEEMIRSGRVDAFVLSDTTSDDKRIPFLLELGYPFVSFGRSNPDWDFPWVDTDGQQGIEQAVHYLLELGHRRIAMAAWPEDSISGNARADGYINTMRAAGHSIPPVYIQRGEHSAEAGERAFTCWMQLPPKERPTAVVCVTDLVASGVMSAAEAHGLVIGRDLSIVGFDDAPLAQYIRPHLTTLQQAIPEITQALLKMLETVLNKDDSLPRHSLIAPRLIIRESCGSPEH
jgi:DNA-binding LacI/PurR family transcriptional regulator